MKLLTVKAEGTEYRLMLFEFGGDEEFFEGKGFGNFGYVAGIVLGPNSALLVDTLFGCGTYAVEKAGLNSYDLVVAWEWILKRFDALPEKGVMILERSADSQYGWKVEEVVEV
jgi:hypothetical protein